MYNNQRVIAIIPALNEQQAISNVVLALYRLQAPKQQTRIIDNVIVCDNGSTDETAAVARNAGAKVVHQAQAGYGIACLTALDEVDVADIILFVDGDDSCVIEQALSLIEAIDQGADLAIGSRTLGHMAKGSLTTVQRFGNWLASGLIQYFWQHKTTDLGPFRAMRYSALQALDMRDESFGWTVEMQVKAIIANMTIKEFPVDSKVRIGQSKISGTVKGSVLAGIGILSMIAKLRLFYQAKDTAVQTIK